MVERIEAVRGQDRAVSLLSRYLESGRVPPGLLFFGEEGIGKEKAAGAFAAALLCRDRTPGGACGTCVECRLLAAGSHPNLLRVAPDGLFIRIDEIRALQEELALKAFSDRPRAVLVVPADRMTLQAANALLKTLEEPPPGTHLLLVAHRLSQVPPTIVSRCQKVPFSPLPAGLVEEILLAVPEAREVHGPDAVRAAAAGAGGSPGRVLALLSEPTADRDAWIRRLGRLDAADAIAAAEAFKGSGEQGRRLAVPLALSRDVALLCSDPKADIINKDRRETLSALALRRAPAGWTRAFRELLSMSRASPQAQKRLMVEAFLFGLHGKD
ncbi:MAG: DNA polymerase III subunit delta' [Deltaproteobacteria bacterium]|nr:DNA polymerase III subunit delta' [Deltaproteobacteria bacterium]